MTRYLSYQLLFSIELIVVSDIKEVKAIDTENYITITNAKNNDYIHIAKLGVKGIMFMHSLPPKIAFLNELHYYQ